MISHSKGKIWESTNIPELQVPYISMQFHAFPNRRMSEFPCYGKSVRKHRQFPGPAVPYRFRTDENVCNRLCLGMYKFP